MVIYYGNSSYKQVVDPQGVLEGLVLLEYIEYVIDGPFHL